MNLNKNPILTDTIPKALAESEIVLPDETHLYAVISNLILLQETYNITVTDMIDGRLTPDQKVEPSLTRTL